MDSVCAQREASDGNPQHYRRRSQPDPGDKLVPWVDAPLVDRNFRSICDGLGTTLGDRVRVHTGQSSAEAPPGASV